MTELGKCTRPSSDYMDSMLGTTLSVDEQHGTITLIDYMGNESSIVQAARVSFGNGTTTKREDAQLIDHMLRNGHTSPFEMCEIKIMVQCPIFVWRQWIRHRTANVNEYSMRYSEPIEALYIPSGLLGIQNSIYMQSHINSLENYNNLIKMGTPREQARIILPLATYTRAYWKIDLKNLLHFLKLRMSRHAQFEIRQYAETIYNLINGWLPNVCQSFKTHILEIE